MLRVNDSTHTLISYFLLEDSLKKMVHIHKITRKEKANEKANEKYDTYKISAALRITKTNLYTT